MAPTDPGSQAFGQTYTLNQVGSKDTTFINAGGGTGPKKASTIFIRADGANNSGTLALWGFNSAQTPIAPNEIIAIDIHPGYWVDLQELHFSGNGNTGQVFYVSAILIP